MAMVRRTRNPWMRSMMALRAARGTVFVLRHGSTARNLGGVGQDMIRGHADVPMTEAGEREVMITAYQIADRRIEVIHTSDLQRATRSAELLSDENVGYPPIEATPALRSWDMGPGMEGKVTTPDVVEQIEEWVDNDTEVPPGGESFKAYCSRIIAFVAPIFENAATGRTVAIVAHGRVVQIIDFWAASGCDEECMRTEFAEFLAEEPDTVPPGGGIHYKNDGLGWIGVVIGSEEPSVGTQIAAGSYVRPANEMAAEENGLPPS
jgi:broad specificity phosphatase PhoE